MWNCNTELVNNNLGLTGKITKSLLISFATKHCTLTIYQHYRVYFPQISPFVISGVPADPVDSIKLFVVTTYNDLKWDIYILTHKASMEKSHIAI